MMTLRRLAAGIACASVMALLPAAANASEPAGERVVAIGDSISTGFNASTTPGNALDLSWATGTDPSLDSIASRFAARDGTVEAENYAVPGTVAATLAPQVTRALQAEPTVITVQVGANDACRSTVDAMTPVDAYERHVADALTTISETSPGTEVLITSVPDLKQLWAVGKDSANAREIWKAMELCPDRLADPLGDSEADRARRDAVQQRVIAYNDVLAGLAEQFPHARFDDYAVYEIDFTAAHVSALDFFHPSASGQAKLAATAWEAFNPARR
jgi:lysophospholipase L1-like esterase